jgi:hypothetical protein
MSAARQSRNQNLLTTEDTKDTEERLKLRNSSRIGQNLIVSRRVRLRKQDSDPRSRMAFEREKLRVFKS